MTILFTTHHYTSQFYTVSPIAEKWRLVEWQFGQAIGHVDFDRIFEATLAVVSLGCRWASEGERGIFESDVLMANL